jgi:hypothetical protein
LPHGTTLEDCPLPFVVHLERKQLLHKRDPQQGVRPVTAVGAPRWIVLSIQPLVEAFSGIEKQHDTGIVAVFFY